MSNSVKSTPTESYFLMRDGQKIPVQLELEEDFAPTLSAGPQAYPQIETSFSGEFSIKVPKKFSRTLECMMNPGMKDFYWFAGIKRAQERRRLARKRRR